MTNIKLETHLPPHPAIPLDVWNTKLKEKAVVRPGFWRQLLYDVKSFAFFFKLNGRDWRLIFAQSYFNRLISPLWLLGIRILTFVSMTVWLVVRYVLRDEHDNMLILPNFQSHILACIYAFCLSLLSFIAIFGYWRHCDGHPSSIVKLPGYYALWTKRIPEVDTVSPNQLGISSATEVVNNATTVDVLQIPRKIEVISNIWIKFLYKITWFLSSCVLPNLLGCLIFFILLCWKFAFLRHLQFVDEPTVILTALLFYTSNVPFLLYHIIYPFTLCIVQCNLVYIIGEDTDNSEFMMFLLTYLIIPTFVFSILFYFINMHKTYFVQKLNFRKIYAIDEASYSYHTV